MFLFFLVDVYPRLLANCRTFLRILSCAHVKYVVGGMQLLALRIIPTMPVPCQSNFMECQVKLNLANSIMI